MQPPCHYRFTLGGNSPNLIEYKLKSLNLSRVMNTQTPLILYLVSFLLLQICCFHQKLVINLFKTKIQNFFPISIYQLSYRKLSENVLNTRSPILFHLKTYPCHIEPSLPNQLLLKSLKKFKKHLEVRIGGKPWKRIC